jgi:hypothetical protein
MAAVGRQSSRLPVLGIVAAALAAWLGVSARARAEAPAFIPIQGYLTDAKGTPVDGKVDIRFALYQFPQAGSEIWSEVQPIAVDAGVFIVYLGLVTPVDLAVFSTNSNLWLGITVEDDEEMQRVFLGSVPYAALAQTCATTPVHQHEPKDLKNVAKAGQMCPAGNIVTGIDANGNVLCTEPGSGAAGFALASQWCPANNVVSGIDANGYAICVPMQGMYSGADFALSGQSCPGTEVVTGISGSGNLVCDPAAGGISGDGASNRIAKWKDADELMESVMSESSGKIGIGTTSPSEELDVKGDMKVSGDFYWGGNKFTSSSCLVVGGSSCSSACSAHGMSCYKAFRIDGPSTDSCSQSGFKMCCCTN